MDPNFATPPYSSRPGEIPLKFAQFFCVTHFWPTLQNHVTDGSEHMRQLDRGEIKLFSLRCLYASIFNCHFPSSFGSLNFCLIIINKSVSRNGQRDKPPPPSGDRRTNEQIKRRTSPSRKASTLGRSLIIY